MSCTREIVDDRLLAQKSAHLAAGLEFFPELDAFVTDEAGKVHRKGVARVPEVPPCDGRAHADVRAAEMRQKAAGRLDVFRVPQAEDCTTNAQDGELRHGESQGLPRARHPG